MPDYKRGIKRQQVVWKSYIFNGFPDATALTVINLTLEHPAEIQFSLTGNNLTNASVFINNDIILQSYRETLNGTGQYPYTVILKNNLDEIDITTYVIKLTNYARLQVLCKYYVNV
jgi:ribosome-interacting GTPase 1